MCCWCSTVVRESGYDQAGCGRLRRTMRCSARRGLKWAASMRAMGRRSWRAWWARRRPARSGSWRGSTMHSRCADLWVDSTWAFGMGLFPWSSFMCCEQPMWKGRKEWSKARGVWFLAPLCNAQQMRQCHERGRLVEVGMESALWHGRVVSTAFRQACITVNL